MKIIINRESFLSAARLAAQAAPAKEVKPILRCIHAIVRDAGCTLIATDLEVGIRIDVRSIKVEELGEAILPPVLLKALAESTDEEMTLEADRSKVILTGDRGRFEFPGCDEQTFPPVAEFNIDTYHEIKGGDLKEIINKTTFAARQDVRFSGTCGAWAEAINGSVALVTTDGCKLSKVLKEAVSHNEHTTKGKQVIIPIKALSLVAANITDDDEKVLVSFTPEASAFKFERTTIHCRNVEGRFPGYAFLFPEKKAFTATIPAGAFLSAVKQAAVCTNDETKRTIFTFKDKRLTIKASTANVGQADIEFPFDFEGTYRADFLPQTLIEMLRRLDPDDQVLIEASEKANVHLVMKCGDWHYAATCLKE